jgi:hypothetical protein
MVDPAEVPWSGPDGRFADMGGRGIEVLGQSRGHLDLPSGGQPGLAAQRPSQRVVLALGNQRLFSPKFHPTSHVGFLVFTVLAAFWFIFVVM